MEFVQKFTPPDFQARNFTPPISPKGRCKKKSKKTSVSFAFTHTYTLEKLTLLLFPPSVHRKF